NIFIIGLSEEFFYRGYLQSLIKKTVQKDIIKSLNFDWAIVITSLFFSIGHFLTYFTFFSILTFFPSLVFGILKNKTGTIYSSILFHAFSNTFLYILMSNN
ncbi:CPBP family intramembrane metalloprotease, partial [bacterium]|nr:CPBP family intramembrane metalloprotease [bacterium]